MEPSSSRGPERQVAEAFVALADTLVTGFDIIEFMHVLAERCVNLLGVDAAGLLITDDRGRLQLMGSSSEQSRLLELFQLQSDQGPCLDSFRSGLPVHCADLAEAHAVTTWPRFAGHAQRRGFRAVSALPMRLREQVIGAMNLFHARPGAMEPGTAALAQAMADIATIGLLQERAIRESQILTEQLQHALSSRVIIEQAKGVIAERHGLSMEAAFALLRGHARSNNQSLTGLAQEVVAHTIALQPRSQSGTSGLPPAP
ncbi:GAF and ANTAR domain-containing protein [Nonomuraea sp. NPDC049784]|uniref:GAF and ANTAR domain-containing protein n=1 Tax=Nonomuraea sp. NPDC049784 TaxID=3154361 RepID=UPI0033EB6F12